ncbi:MAG TPA: SDR family NAD(P)-dependent oxidoreductase [Pyrinomonadaceae bacterium]|nr:SDR family NAD(P)-dependent oxidoreductase [Pyrinomonadaceae bacterium]
MNWKDKVVLITGASSGIGRGLAIELARRGAAVGLFARRIEALREVEAEIVNAGGRAISLSGDVLCPESLREAAWHLSREFGIIDLMIANAGIGAATRGHNLPLDDVARIINVNLIGAANSAAAVIPTMVSRGSGRVVAIASLAAYRGLPNSAAYCASKAGVSKLYESLRVDLHGTGVEVTVIFPGFVRTKLTATHTNMLFLMDVDTAVRKIVRAIERGKQSYSFPWQLASFVRAGLFFPIWLYDRVALRYAYRQ